MSAHDYMRRSGYAEDAYSDHLEKVPVMDVEGRRWAVSGYGRSLGTRTYVRKVESYVQEISKSKPAYSSSVTMGFPSMESGSFSSDGRPQEVHDFLMKILTEVNGPPHRTSDPNLGTNQGEHTFPHEPPTRTSAPNLGRVDVHGVDQRFGPYGTSQMKTDPPSEPPVRPSHPGLGRGRYIFPVKEEIRDNYGDGHRYGSSLAKAEPTMGYGYGYGYDYGYSSSPRKSEKAHNHQWGQSSTPVYDPQWGSSGVKTQSPSRNYGDSSNQQGKSSTFAYNHPHVQNPPSGPKDQWGSSPVKTQSPGDDRATVSQLGRPSTPVYDHQQNKRSGPKDPWRSPPAKTQSPKGYGNQWDRPSSSPSYDHPPNDEQHNPPQVTCKDGVCTLNNKPKAPQGNTEPYTDHQPRNFGRSTNQMLPSGYHLGEALEPLHLDAGTPPEGGAAAVAGKSSGPAAGFSGARKLTVLPRVGPIRETMVGPRDIDSEEVVRRYGGCSIPWKPYE